jgi:hypothetical protein
VVLLSFLLVLAAAVTLVIGLLNGGLGLIYLSIACSLGAGIVLALAVMRSRPRAVPALGGPAPIAGGWGDEEPTAVSSKSVRRQEAAPAWDGQATAPFDETTFPIAGYDGLKVTDILPLLPELEQDELDQVRAHEAGAKNRSRILGRIEMLTSEASWDAPAEDWEPEPAPARAERSATRTATSRRAAATIVEEDLDVADDGDFDEYDDAAGDDDDDFDDDDFGDDFDDDVFPIADYDELKVGEIMPLLPELDDDELDMVRDRESRGQARAMIIGRIDRLHGGPPAAAAKRAPAAKKTAATRRPSAAKKTTATKRASGAKKATAKKTAAKKTTAKKATGKKSAAKKTAAKKSATRSTAKKTASKRR